MDEKFTGYLSTAETCGRISYCIARKELHAAGFGCDLDAQCQYPKPDNNTAD